MWEFVWLEDNITKHGNDYCWVTGWGWGREDSSLPRTWEGRRVEGRVGTT